MTRLISVHSVKPNIQNRLQDVRSAVKKSEQFLANLGKAKQK